MNSIFLFDIDGTLSKDGIIPSSAINTLKMLRSNGNIVMLATGRCLGQLQEVLSKIEVDGAILNNGALAYINDDVIFESPIDKDVILKMISDGLNVAVLTKNDFVRFEENKIYKEFTSVFNIDQPRLESIDILDKEKAYSLGVYSYNLDNIELEEYSNLRFVKVCNLGYDVINKGVTKATPISYLKKKYPKYKIISFGDNYNDIEMLKTTDISIAMSEAPKEVKDCADFVTKDVLNDGIQYAVLELLRGYYEKD